jgi:predicted small metal-binding protein
MSKRLECRSIVPGCNFVAHGENEDDLMMKAADHARAAHGVEHLSEPLRAKIKASIKDETPAR